MEIGSRLPITLGILEAANNILFNFIMCFTFNFVWLEIRCWGPPITKLFKVVGEPNILVLLSCYSLYPKESHAFIDIEWIHGLNMAKLIPKVL